MSYDVVTFYQYAQATIMSFLLTQNALVDEERNFQKELLDGVPYKPEEQYAEAEQKENDGLSTVLEIPVHHPLADPYKVCLNFYFLEL